MYNKNSSCSYPTLFNQRIASSTNIFPDGKTPVAYATLLAAQHPEALVH